MLVEGGFPDENAWPLHLMPDHTHAARTAKMHSSPPFCIPPAKQGPRLCSSAVAGSTATVAWHTRPDCEWGTSRGHS